MSVPCAPRGASFILKLEISDADAVTLKAEPADGGLRYTDHNSEPLQLDDEAHVVLLHPRHSSREIDEGRIRVPLEDVPPVIYWEACRAADLLMSVASYAYTGDDLSGGLTAGDTGLHLFSEPEPHASPARCTLSSAVNAACGTWEHSTSRT